MTQLDIFKDYTLEEIVLYYAQEVIINHSKYGKMHYIRDKYNPKYYQGKVYPATVYGLLTQDEVISYEIK